MDYNKKIILNFLEKNYDKDVEKKYLISYSNIPIICENIYKKVLKKDYDGIPFIHIRKETYEWNPSHHNYDKFNKLNGKILYGDSLLIDCIDENYGIENFKKRVFIPWCLLSFSSRNIDIDSLLNTVKYFKDKREKSKFCAFMYSNTGKNNKYIDSKKITTNDLIRKAKNFIFGKYDKTKYWKNNYHDFVNERFKFYEILNKIENVDTPKGENRYSENIFNEAVDLLGPYKFNIAFENSNCKGWVTEKIVNSFLAGCIPIYFGHESVFNYFNKKAIIYAKDFSNYNELCEYIIEVNNNNELYNSIITHPICTSYGYHNLQSHINEIKKI